MITFFDAKLCLCSVFSSVLYIFFYQSWDYRNAALSSEEYCSIDGCEVLIYLLSDFGLCMLIEKHLCLTFLRCCRMLGHTHTSSKHHHHHRRRSVLLLLLLLILYSFLYYNARADTKNTRKEQKNENEKQCVRWTKSHVLNSETSTGQNEKRNAEQTENR